MTGTLEIDGETLTHRRASACATTRGGRATGRRSTSYQWLTINFGADFGAMVSMIQRDPEGKQRAARRRGRARRRDRARSSTRRSTADVRRERPLPQGSPRHGEDGDSGEELEIDGEVTGFIPLRNRREGLTTHIGEGMTRWRFGDHVGYGLSEFLEQVE